MNLFLNFKNKKNNIILNDIKSKDYTQEYFNECKYIWKEYVPKNGQANCLQGELLREIEKIRCEAQDNGNINWDDDYSYFCDFIKDNLNNKSIFTAEEKEEITTIMNYIKDCGLYSRKCYNGELEKDSIDINRIAYTNDNLYDIIADKIGKLQKNNPEPIPYSLNKNIKR